jgi:ATP-dependent DNA helicase DinG
MQDLVEFFGPESPLRSLLPGFQPRAGQSWMADAVADALAKNGKLVVEAGTGTGKTFAYLLPALMSGRKTIISTGTKALQDQLYHRDLPLISKAVGRPVSTALLKGRANYLCLHRLDSVAGHSAAGSQLDDLKDIREWRHRTTSGDRAELTEVAEDSSVWPLVTSTVDNCLGSRCPVYQECHVVKARRAAQESDLVVVNHHLLLADLAMKEEGFIEFLPGAEAIILDEAHQIPDLAAQFFGISLGSRELERLFDELRTATIPVSQPELQRRIDKAATALKVLRADAPRDEGRYELSAILPDIREPVDDLRSALQTLQQGASQLADASIEIAGRNRKIVTPGQRRYLGRAALARCEPPQFSPAPDAARRCRYLARIDRQRPPVLDIYVGDTRYWRRLQPFRRAHGLVVGDRPDVSQSLCARGTRPDLAAAGFAAALRSPAHLRDARTGRAAIEDDRRRHVLPVYQSPRIECRAQMVQVAP